MTDHVTAAEIAAGPLGGAIGAEVFGCDPEHEIPADVARDLRSLWLDKGLLLFRGVGRSAEGLLRLSRVFGTLEPHPIESLRLPEHPELILLTNRDGPSGPVYDMGGVHIHGCIPWHTDLAFKTVPNAGALLRMVQRTETGGQTAWTDTAQAYDALDAETKRRIAGLEARYEFCKDLESMRFNRPAGVRVGARPSTFPDFPPIARPLVWAHPETGRTILNLSTLNIHSIIGLPQPEGDRLIRQLIDHVTRPQFVYTHDWRNDDIMLWDNRRMMHAALGHPVDQVRIVQRSTLKGEVAVGRVIAAGPDE